MSGNKFRKSNLRNEMTFLPFKSTNVSNIQKNKIKIGSPHINLKTLVNLNNKVAERSLTIKSSLSQDQYDKEDKIVKLNYKKGQHKLHQAICTNSAYSLHNNLTFLKERKEIDMYKSFIRFQLQQKHGRVKNVNKCLARQNNTDFTREYMAGDNNLSKKNTKLRKHIMASYSDRSNLSIEDGQHTKHFFCGNIRRRSILKPNLLTRRSSLTKSQILVLKKHINYKNKSNLKTSLSYSTIKHEVSEKYNRSILRLRKTSIKNLHKNKNYKAQIFSNPTNNKINTCTNINNETFSNDWKKPDIESATIFHQNIGNKMKFLVKQKKKYRKDNSLESNSDEIYNHQLTQHNRLHSKLKINTEMNLLPQSGFWNRKTIEDEIKSSNKKRDHIILTATGTRNENNNNKVAVLENKFMTSTLTSSSKQTNSIKKLICQLWNDQSNNNVNDIKSYNRNLKTYSSSCSKSRRSIEIRKMQKEINNHDFPCVKAAILNTGEDEVKMNEVTMFKKLNGYLNIFGNKRVSSDHGSKLVKIYKKDKLNIEPELVDKTMVKLRDIGCTTMGNKKREHFCRNKYDCNKIDGNPKKCKNLKNVDHFETKYSESGTAKVFDKKRTPRKLIGHSSSCDKTDMRIYRKLAELGYFGRNKNLKYYRLLNNTRNENHVNLKKKKKVTQNKNSEILNKICNKRANRKSNNTIKFPVSPFNQNIYHHVTRLSDCHRKLMKRKQNCHHFNLKKKRKYKFLNKHSNKTNKGFKKVIPDLKDLHSTEHNMKVLQDGNGNDEQLDDPGKLSKNNKSRKDSAIQWSNHDYLTKNSNQTDFDDDTLYKLTYKNRKDIQSRRENESMESKNSHTRIQIKTGNDKKMHVKFSDENIKALPHKGFCQLKHDEDFLNDKNIKNSIKILRAKQNELKKRLQAFDDDIIRKKLEWYEKIKKELQCDLERRCKVICGKRCCVRERNSKFGGKIFSKCRAAKIRFAQILRSGLTKISAGKLNFETQDIKATEEIIKSSESKQKKLRVKSSKTEWRCGCQLSKKSSKLSEKDNFLLYIPYLQSEDNFKQDDDMVKSYNKSASENAYLKARRSPKLNITNVKSNSDPLRNKQQIKSVCSIQSFQHEDTQRKRLKCTHIKKNISKEMEKVNHRNVAKKDLICLQTTSNSYKDVTVIKSSSSALDKSIKNIDQGSAQLKKQQQQNENTISSDNSKGDIIQDFAQKSDKSSKHNIEAINWSAELEKMYEQIKKCSAQIKELDIQNIDSKKKLSKHGQSTSKVKKEGTHQPVISKEFNDRINNEDQVACACAQMNGENKNEELESKNSKSKYQCLCPPTEYICIPPKVCCTGKKIASKNRIGSKIFENETKVYKQNLKHGHKVLQNNQGKLVQEIPEISKQTTHCNCQNINSKNFKHKTSQSKLVCNNQNLDHPYSRLMFDNIQEIDSCTCTVKQKSRELTTCNCRISKDLHCNCEIGSKWQQKNGKHKKFESCKCSLSKLESFHKANGLKPVQSRQKNSHFETGCNCQNTEEETFGVSATSEALQIKYKNCKQKSESQSSQSNYEIDQIQCRKSQLKNNWDKIASVSNKLRTLFHKDDKPYKLCEECRCEKYEKENIKIRTESSCDTNLKRSKHGQIYKFLGINSKSKTAQIKLDKSKQEINCECLKCKLNVHSAKQQSGLLYLEKNKSAPGFTSKRKESDQKIYCECQKLNEIISKDEKTSSFKQLKSNKVLNLNSKLKGNFCGCHKVSSKHLSHKKNAMLKEKESDGKVYCECKKIKEIKTKLEKTKENKRVNINSQSKVICGCVKMRTKRKQHLPQKNGQTSKSSLQRKKHLKQPLFVKCKCWISKRISKVRKRPKSKRKKRKNIRKKRKTKPLPAPIIGVKNCFIDTYHLMNNYKCNKNFLGLTLQKRPCFCIYKICPWLYPYCLNGLSCTKQTFRLFLLGLGFVFWLPCMLCTSCLFCKKFC